MRWGLVPAFAKRAEDYDVFKGGSSTFNARIEGAESSGLWRRLLNSKRGVVLFDGFYEWKTKGKAKTPMFIRNRDEYDGHVICAHHPNDADKVVLPVEQEKPPQAAESAEAESVKQEKPLQAAESAEAESAGPKHAPLMLAALYDEWHRPDDTSSGEKVTSTEKVESEAAGTSDALESATILTMEPDGTPMWEVHNRMPVFLTAETASLWLDHSQPYNKIVSTVVKASQAHAQKQLLLYEVSTLVSNVKSESPDCILPKKEVDAKKFSAGLGRFFQKASPSAGDKRPAEDAEPAGDAKAAKK